MFPFDALYYTFDQMQKSGDGGASGGGGGGFDSGDGGYYESEEEIEDFEKSEVSESDTDTDIQDEPSADETIESFLESISNKREDKKIKISRKEVREIIREIFEQKNIIRRKNDNKEIILFIENWNLNNVKK